MKTCGGIGLEFLSAKQLVDKCFEYVKTSKRQKVKKGERLVTNEEVLLHWIDLSVTGICLHNDYLTGM